ncbi:MAG: hypothetical protein QXM08_03885 [Thermofilaceae archaeon]
MSVELRILLPKRVWEAIKRRAEREKVTIEELVLLAIEKVLTEEKVA